MTKFFTLAVAATSLILLTTAPEIGRSQTCVAETSCGSQPLQFTPGEWFSVEIVNLTAGVVEVEQIDGTDAVPLSPGQILHLVNTANSKNNFSLKFSDAIGLSLGAKLSKPEPKKLRIELLPGGRPPGDQSIYLREDGRIDIL